MVDKDSDGRIYKEESEEIKYKIILFKFVQHTRWRRKEKMEVQGDGCRRGVERKRKIRVFNARGKRGFMKVRCAERKKEVQQEIA